MAVAVDGRENEARNGSLHVQLPRDMNASGERP